MATNWGRATVGTLFSSINYARSMGGQSPNLDDMLLRAISMYVGVTHTTQARLAVYSGGSLTTGPDTASLLYDFGQTTGTGVSQWLILNYTGDDILIPKNTPLWCAFKGNDATINIAYDSTFPGGSDFQSARGRYNSVAVSTDETVAYPSTWPTDTGTFASFWYSTYLTYLIEAQGYGMRFRSGNSESTSTVSTFNPPVNCTICFWVYLTSLGTRIMGSGNLFEIYTDISTPATGRVVNDMFQGTGGNFYSTTGLNIETLYHIACTRASDNSAAIYINGVEDNTASLQDGSPVTTNSFQLGNRPTGTQYFDGYLEDVRIYDRVLSAGEVQTIYALKGIDSITYGLLHRWLLNEMPQETTASGTGSIKDYGSSQNNMTPTNTPEYTGSRIRTMRLS